MTIAKKYFIFGRVQGVGFRVFVEEWALRLGLHGYVRNLRDGRVEVYAVGNTDKLDVFRGCLEKGPRSARVISVEAKDENVNTAYSNFNIEGSW